MSKHTKEPWHVYDGTTIKAKHQKVFDSRGMVFVDLGDSGWVSLDCDDMENTDEANAKRIVAAINFCEGFTNQQLKDMGSLKGLIEILLEGDEALEALAEKKMKELPSNVKPMKGPKQ